MKVSILGCGRWASFHAWYQANVLGNNVLMWGRGEDQCFIDLSKLRKNGYLELPKSVELTDDLGAALKYSDYVIISISSQAMANLSDNIAKHDPKGKTFVLCMKGIDNKTGERLSQILKGRIDESNKICVWVGPGHVQDFLAGQPNIMIIDGEDPKVVKDVVSKFASNLIKLYGGNDLVGAEIGAAAKNVMGIAAGLLDGAQMPRLKGVLMARGCWEVSQLITAMGGKQLTAYGISHLGDFEATLFSQNSHNRRYGEEFMKARLHGRLMKQEGLAEGVETVKALNLLRRQYNVQMPITKLVYQIIHEDHDANLGLDKILNRINGEEFK